MSHIKKLLLKGYFLSELRPSVALLSNKLLIAEHKTLLQSGYEFMTSQLVMHIFQECTQFWCVYVFRIIQDLCKPSC